MGSGKRSLNCCWVLLQLPFTSLEPTGNDSTLQCTRSCLWLWLSAFERFAFTWSTEMVCLSNIQLLLFFIFFSVLFLFFSPPSDLLWDKVTFWNACSRFDLSTEQAIYGKGTWHRHAELRICCRVKDLLTS